MSSINIRRFLAQLHQEQSTTAAAFQATMLANEHTASVYLSVGKISVPDAGKSLSFLVDLFMHPALGIDCSLLEKC